MGGIDGACILQKRGERDLCSGHNSFTRSPDDQEDWIVYHALPAAGAEVALRATRIQKVGWNPDGTPDFRIPGSATQPLTVPSGECGE
ncbi:family 43 glycosylhydrolase [Paenibacillus albidus]|uniref:family 43 glycosylhydrolase n=1 Tax=Paenibacillus albidus TaxID=2041023 RepID=UPI001E58B6B3|nr:family 43 glycosylhydrolase [Paenibacillus albidus]